MHFFSLLRINRKKISLFKYFLKVIISPEEFKRFPTTRYQGSKRKILPWIYEVLKDIEFNTVLDACGGTGSVSYLFKKMGKAVTYNDHLFFNYQIGKALIENSKNQLLPEDIQGLIIKKPNTIYSSFISSNFEDIYYKKKENEWLDITVKNIITMNHYKPNILQYKKALAFYALFQACLIKRPFNLFHRKNLNLRLAEVKRNFGNKTSWEKEFSVYLPQFANEINGTIFNSKILCIAKNESIFDIDPNGYDLVYIDPPYINKNGSSESSNYMKCYHFLEGLSRYYEWENLIDLTSINKRFKNSVHDDRFNKDAIKKSIEEIIYKFRKSKIVFSYKKGGVPSIDFIKKSLEKHKNKVYTVSKEYKYALNKQNSNSNTNREVLIIGI